MEFKIKKPGNSEVETYTKDMVKVLESNEEGLIQKIIHEQEERELESQKSSPESRKNRFFLILSIFLLVLAVVSLGYLYLNRDASTVEVQKAFTPLIFNDKTETIDISKLNKEKTNESILKVAKETEVKIGGVSGIYLSSNQQAVGFSKFVSFMKMNLPENYAGVIGENFLIGVVNNEDTNQKDAETIPDKKIQTPIEVVTEGEPVTLNNSAFFKTGTTIFKDSDAKDKAKKVISDFLDTVDFTTSKIKIVGTYSIERPSDKNEIIAEERRKVGVDILMEVLAEKYTKEEISKITISSVARGVSINDIYSKDEISAMLADELLAAIDSTQGVQYFVEAKTKPKVVTFSAVGTITDTSKFGQYTQTGGSVVEQTDTNAGINKTKNKTVVKSQKDLFILFKVLSFPDAFVVMNAWESKMFLDLHELFQVEINADTSYLLTKSFEDGIVQNKNARILYDNTKEKNIIFMYVYADDNSVVFADREQTVKEIIARLASSKVRK